MKVDDLVVGSIYWDKVLKNLVRYIERSGERFVFNDITKDIDGNFLEGISNSYSEVENDLVLTTNLHNLLWSINDN